MCHTKHINSLTNPTVFFNCISAALATLNLVSAAATIKWIRMSGSVMTPLARNFTIPSLVWKGSIHLFMKYIFPSFKNEEFYWLCAHIQDNKRNKNPQKIYKIWMQIPLPPMFLRRISFCSAQVLSFSLLPAIYTADAAKSDYMTNFSAYNKAISSMIWNLSSLWHYCHILAGGWMDDRFPAAKRSTAFLSLPQGLN